MSNDATAPLIRVEGLAKRFTLHQHDAARINVFEGLDFEVRPGECVVLAGPSGVGKSTLMRCLYGNYLVDCGHVLVRHDGREVDLVSATPQQILGVRRRSLGYVSQFLRVIPRVPTLQLVMEPLLENGVAADEAECRARDMLGALNLPEEHWGLPPATFSGGEQQRVNIARSFVRRYPILLLDEPTASLDAGNREIVVRLIREALAEGAAMVGIFHDEDVRNAVATRTFEVAQYRAAA
ncbi:phosphonate C-P lyase system protein PhnL [bacterium]|nr:phosphonate C-P lyase system protein PhnL [bacterium]